MDHRSPPLRHYVHYFGFYLGVTATIVWLLPALPLLRPADLPGRRVMGRARRATICRSQDASRREGCRSNRLRSLYRPRSTGSTLQRLGSCSSRSSTSQIESVGGKVFGCSWQYRSCHLPRGCSGQHCFKPVGLIGVVCLDHLGLFDSGHRSRLLEFLPFPEVRVRVGVKPDQPLIVFRHMLVPPLTPPVIPGAGESSHFPFLNRRDDQVPF